LGCAGIDLRHNESALFADTPQEFADAILRIFNDEQLRLRLVDRASATVREKHEWGAQGLLLEKVYQAVVSGRAQDSPAA
jgi:glycosyltransferase involved in cell wall biosynthesis